MTVIEPSESIRRNALGAKVASVAGMPGPDITLYVTPSVRPAPATTPILMNLRLDTLFVGASWVSEPWA